jgi:hypothetical protein
MRLDGVDILYEYKLISVFIEDGYVPYIPASAAGSDGWLFQSVIIYLVCVYSSFNVFTISFSKYSLWSGTNYYRTFYGCKENTNICPLPNCICYNQELNLI